MIEPVVEFSDVFVKANSRRLGTAEN